MKPIAILLALLLDTTVLLAQTAPCTTPAPPPPPPLTGKAELSFVSTTGNSDSQMFGAGLEFDYANGPWSALAKGAFVRGATRGAVTAESSSGELRGARQLTPKLEVFVQADFLRNTFAGIAHHWDGLAGAAYSFIETKRQTLKGSLGAGYTAETRVVPPNKNFVMGQADVLYAFKISNTADLSEEVVYTRDFKDSADWRVANTLGVSVAMTSLLSLKASHGLLYLNEPAAGFGKTNTITSVALVAKF